MTCYFLQPPRRLKCTFVRTIKHSPSINRGNLPRAMEMSFILHMPIPRCTLNGFHSAARIRNPTSGHSSSTETMQAPGTRRLLRRSRTKIHISEDNLTISTRLCTGIMTLDRGYLRNGILSRTSPVQSNSSIWRRRRSHLPPGLNAVANYCGLLIDDMCLGALVTWNLLAMGS